MLELNKIYEGNCIEIMRDIDAGVVDLTVTSPPYDNLRDYKGYSFDFEGVASELYRVTKEGGVVVWVVGDATIKGDETGSSFRQALYFKELGFKLHDTMIYTKGGQGATGSNKSYWQDFEYMFVMVKGELRTFSPIMDRKNKTKPKSSLSSSGHRHKDGRKKGKRVIERKAYGKRFNVWCYHEAGTRTDHPAVFPEKLAHDHIISWSNEGDLVLDPFNGSGTTCLMSKINSRNYIGIDISGEYCELARRQIDGGPALFERKETEGKKGFLY